jgi:hypothetical protein
MSAEYRTMVNAARDLADSFNRFERDFARFRRIVQETPRAEVAAALTAACDSEKRRRAIELLDQRLAAATRAESGEGA